MATVNICSFLRIVRVSWRLLAPLLLCHTLTSQAASSTGAGQVGTPPDSQPPTERRISFSESARVAYEHALSSYHLDPKNTTNAIELARTAFDWAGFATSKGARAQIATQGIQACRRLILEHPEMAAAHYYLAMNLGQLAENRGLGALSLVDQMEESFKKARQLNPRLDFAGPDRSLGLLYHDAPHWPISIGSKTKARQHLESAVLLSPEYPGNHLDLLEAYVAWRDVSGVKHEIDSLKTLLPAARTNFTGAAWAQSWQEWDARWKKLKAEADALSLRK